MADSTASYTPEQIKMFRQRLMEEYKKLLDRYHASRDSLQDKPSNENKEETGSEDFIHAADLYMMGHDAQTLNMIQNAMKHLSTGDYGICEDCGKPIGEARLKARPFARYCIKCKTRREENGGLGN